MYSIVAACALAFFYTLDRPTRGAAQRLILMYGVIPAQFTGHAPSFPAALPLRLLTSVFLHGGWLHIAGNMLFLWVFGDNVEDAMGHGPFLLFYLVCGVAASLLHILTHPLSTDPTIGASGAIAGVLGAYLILYPRARVLSVVWLWIFLRFVWTPAIFFLPVWILFQLVAGLASLGGSQAGGVAFWAHIGGFLSGMTLVRLFAPVPAR